MATHSSILAWRIPWTQEPSGLQSMGITKSQTRLRDLPFHTDQRLLSCLYSFISQEIPTFFHFVFYHLLLSLFILSFLPSLCKTPILHTIL